MRKFLTSALFVFLSACLAIPSSVDRDYAFAPDSQKGLILIGLKLTDWMVEENTSFTVDWAGDKGTGGGFDLNWRDTPNHQDGKIRYFLLPVDPGNYVLSNSSMKYGRRMHHVDFVNRSQDFSLDPTRIEVKAGRVNYVGDFSLFVHGGYLLLNEVTYNPEIPEVIRKSHPNLTSPIDLAAKTGKIWR